MPIKNVAILYWGRVNKNNAMKQHFDMIVMIIELWQMKHIDNSL